MRCRQSKRAARAEFLEQRDGQGRAFFGRGSRAHFVYQNQRAVGGDFEHRLQVQHVRRKRGEVGGNRLLVADIRQNAIENRQFGAGCRDRNRRLRRKSRESNRLQRNRFAAGIRPAHHHNRFLAAHRECQRHGFAALRAQRSFEHWIARRFQAQRISRREFRHHAVVVASKPAPRENGIEMRDGRRGGFERAVLTTKPFRELFQDARDLRQLVLAELDQPIIQIDSFERLDENGLPRSAGAVNHSRHGAAFRCSHGNHEAVVPQRDVIFADWFAASPHDRCQ
jgi:hypothetical protein